MPHRLRVPRIALALGGAAIGLYLLRAFELLSKLIAALSLLPASGRAIPWPFEVAGLAAEGALLSLCFWPLLRLAFPQRLIDPRAKWIGGALFALLTAYASLVHWRYLHLRAALPLAQPHANQCPWYTPSGLAFGLNRILLVPPELVIDSNNEQCTLLKLAHDTELGMDVEWDVFKARAYDPRFVLSHYSENSVFALSAALGKALRSRERAPKDRMAILALTDEAGIAAQAAQAASFILSQHKARVRDFDPGSNPFARLTATIRSGEESLLSAGLGRTQAR